MAGKYTYKKVVTYSSAPMSYSISYGRESPSISISETRYDFKSKMHHHFLCKQCGKIIDIDIECPNINRIIKEGYKVDEVHGYFKGLCKNCKTKGTR